MASEKKRRKLGSLDRRERLAALPPRPPKDGDRRRRDAGPLVREALARKRSLREWTIDSDNPPLLPEP